MGIEGQFAGLIVRTRRQPAFAGDGVGKDYLYDIRRFAILERDQEYALAKRWRERGDRDAANQLVTSHLRLAAKIAMGYRGYGLPVSEIISEGNVGLMQALNRFEPEKGFRFATYAIWWIRASIQDYILRSWSLVKIGTTVNQKRLFFKLRSAKSKIAAFESGDLHPDQVALIAKSLDVTDQDVVDMNRRLGGDRSINAPLHDDGQTGEWQDYFVDQSPSPEAIVVEQDDREHQHNALIAAIDVLNDRERRIFEARQLFDEPLTLDELAAQFNVSRERIRQIEVRAFEKVRKAARNLATKAPAAMQEAWDALNRSADSVARSRAGAVRISNENRMFIGANAMRLFLPLGLLIALCASASAATVHHAWHHVIVGPSQGWAYAAPRSPVHYDDTPSYNDPSKFGGSAALPATP